MDNFFLNKSNTGKYHIDYNLTHHRNSNGHNNTLMDTFNKVNMLHKIKYI